MKNDWTPEQNALLIKIWPTGENLKPHIPALGNRKYNTIISHAHKVLNLGSRPKSARGTPAHVWKAVLAELEKHPGTAPELIKRTRLSMAPVCKYLREANPGPDSEIHILSYRKRSTGGAPVAVYAFGPGENAAVPQPFTTAEKWKLKCARRRRSVNPFAAVCGQIQPPAASAGRVINQLVDDDREAA